MSVLYLANVLAVSSCFWSVWIRRHTFGSRWDAPLTVGIVLYGVASALDTPWGAVAAASYPLTGKYYLLNTVGHICFLAGTAAGAQSVCIRLLPDAELHRLMRTRILPLVAVAAAVMLVCVTAGPAADSMRAPYLYGAPLDGWMRVYFATFLLTLTGILWLTLFGGVRLSGEPPGPGPAWPLLLTASVGSLACLGFLAVILTGRADLVPTLWPVAYLATTVSAVTCAVAWTRRVAELTRAPEEP